MGKETLSSNFGDIESGQNIREERMIQKDGTDKMTNKERGRKLCKEKRITKMLTAILQRRM